MTKLAIFDLDGTLLDTVGDLGQATNFALGQCGFPSRPTNDYYTLCGRGIYNLFRGAVPAGQDTEENIKKMAGHFLAYYDKHMCDKTLPYPGIPEMLKKITAAGVTPALASNKYQAGAEKLISHVIKPDQIMEAYQGLMFEKETWHCVAIDWKAD